MIVDDFTISGGTLIDIANTLKAKGAGRIFAVLSHINIKEDGLRRLEASPIEFIVSTDTVHCPFAGKSDKLRIISAAPLFAETVRRIHDREGLGEMFAHLPERVFEQSFMEQLRFNVEE